MNRNDMYHARFKLKHKTPWPQLNVCDYPNTTQALSFLEQRLYFLLSAPVKMPDEMKYGIAYKCEAIKKYLLKHKEFFEQT
jgi:hypothetical protein